MGKRPGRIKDIIDVRLPRPRNVLDMQNDREFIEVRRRIWNSLREEVISLRTELKVKGANHE